MRGEENMKILFTGGAGYIGSHTCVELLEAGYDVVIVDNLYNSSRKAVDRICEITGRSVDFYEADISDREALDKIFTEHAIDAVIHFVMGKVQIIMKIIDVLEIMMTMNLQELIVVMQII